MFVEFTMKRMFIDVRQIIKQFAKTIITPDYTYSMIKMEITKKNLKDFRKRRINEKIYVLDAKMRKNTQETS